MSEEVLEPTGETPTVVQALSAVMADVRAVAKKEKNTSQGGGFFFRGIDAVVNAVGPALRTHGVVVTPPFDVRHPELRRGHRHVHVHRPRGGLRLRGQGDGEGYVRRLPHVSPAGPHPAHG